MFCAPRISNNQNQKPTKPGARSVQPHPLLRTVWPSLASFTSQVVLSGQPCLHFFVSDGTLCSWALQTWLPTWQGPSQASVEPSMSPWSCDLLGEGPWISPLLYSYWRLMCRTQCQLGWWRTMALGFRRTRILILALEWTAVGYQASSALPSKQRPRPNSSNNKKGVITPFSVCQVVNVC